MSIRNGAWIKIELKLEENEKTAWIITLFKYLFIIIANEANDLEVVEIPPTFLGSHTLLPCSSDQNGAQKIHQDAFILYPIVNDDII